MSPPILNDDMTKQENLDAILKFICYNEGEQLRPEKICELASVNVDKTESYLMLDFLCKEGYVKRIDNPQSFYIGLYNGRLFLDNGGYHYQHYLYKRGQKAKWVSDYFDLAIKPLTVASLFVGVLWVIIQIYCLVLI